MGPSEINFCKLRKLRPFTQRQEQRPRTTLEEIAKKLSCTRRRSRSSVRNSKINGSGVLYLRRNLASGVEYWPTFEKNCLDHQKRLEIRCRSNKTPIIRDLDDEERQLIRSLEEKFVGPKAKNFEEEENNVIQALDEQFGTSVDDSIEDELADRTKGRQSGSKDGSNELGEGTSDDEYTDEDYKAPGEDGESSDDYSMDSSDEENIPDGTNNFSKYVPDFSKNVLQGFFRTLTTASPLKCYYTLWYAPAVMRRHKGPMNKLIPRLKELSESRQVLKMIADPPKDAVSGRIENFGKLSHQAQRTLHLWGGAMRRFDPESAEESGPEDDPVEIWNYQFPLTNSTPLMLKHENVLARMDSRKRTSNTPQTLEKRTRNTPVASKDLTPRDTPRRSLRKLATPIMK